MRSKEAVKLLNSLGSEIRLTIVKKLIKSGHEGLNPSEISLDLKIAPNKLTFHLNHLKQHDLAISKRSGRSIKYFFNFHAMQDLLNYLFEKCCESDKMLNNQCIEIPNLAQKPNK